MPAWEKAQTEALMTALASPLRGEAWLKAYRESSGDIEHSVGAIYAYANTLSRAFALDARPLINSLQKMRKTMPEKEEFVPSSYVAKKFGVDARSVGHAGRWLGVDMRPGKDQGRPTVVYNKAQIDALSGNYYEIIEKNKLKVPAPVTPAPVTPAPVTPAPVTPAPVTPAPVTPAKKVSPADIVAAWRAGVLSEDEMVQKIKALT